MAGEERFHFHIQMDAKDLWMFSMYHANKGYLGVFNVLFTLVCVLMFTVWQPGLLFLKAMKQLKNDRMKSPMDMTFTKEGFTVTQKDQSMDVAWDQIRGVVGIRGEYILYMGQMRAYLIPDRILGQDKEKFAGFLREVLPGERLKRV